MDAPENGRQSRRRTGVDRASSTVPQRSLPFIPQADIHLFEHRLVTLALAAKLAGQSIEEFFDGLQASDIDVVDYPAEELAGELKALS